MHCALCTDLLNTFINCMNCHAAYCEECTINGVCRPCTEVHAAGRISLTRLTVVNLEYLQLYVRNNYSEMEEASKSTDKHELARIIMHRETPKTQQGANRFPQTSVYTNSRVRTDEVPSRRLRSVAFPNAPSFDFNMPIGSNSQPDHDFVYQPTTHPVHTIDLTVPDVEEERPTTATAASNHISNLVTLEEARIRSELNHYTAQDENARRAVLESRLNPASVFSIRDPTVRTAVAARMNHPIGDIDQYAQSSDERRAPIQQEQESSYLVQTGLQQTQQQNPQQWQQQQQQQQQQTEPLQHQQVQWFPQHLQQTQQRQPSFQFIQPIDMRITGGNQQQQSAGLYPWDTDTASVAHSHYSSFRGLMSPGGGSIGRVGRTSGLPAGRMLSQHVRHQHTVATNRFNPYGSIAAQHFSPDSSPFAQVAAATHIMAFMPGINPHRTTIPPPPVLTEPPSSPPCPSLSELLTDDKVQALSEESLRRVLKKNYVDSASMDHERMVKRVIELRGLVQKNGIKSQLAGDGDDENMCKICFERPIDCVLLECGHMCSCFTCTTPLKDCPICREKISRAVRTFKC